ncbi:hypothetical protein U14_04119 [Candidatus Moduliflexus flocculans]|uniref:Bacterial repeat domain-containing protein n=1 Tax=Candidatus Moduliflexus flocculans TaxID=1499966 RepID=A0A0S6W5C8_9BACT|nr:hypothetical protein U14_04119 [Candidatus Moduliflexus flocculans]
MFYHDGWWCGITVSLIFFSSQVPAFDSFTTTVSFYDGVNLSTGATEVEPTVLTLVIGSAQEVERIAAPEIDPLFHFSPSVHVSFGLTAHPAQPVMLQPHAEVAFAIVEQTDPASLTETQLAALDYAAQPVTVAPHQFVVAKLGDGIYRILGQIASNPDATVQFTVWTPEVGSVPTVTPTPPVSEPTATPTPPVSVPEPGTFALFAVGVLLLCRGKFWKKHCVKGGISMKQARLMVLFVGLLVGLSNSGWAAEVMVIKIGTGEGIVDGGDDIFCGASCEATYEKGTVVQLKAIPDENAKFDGWLVNGKPHEGTLVVEDENILVAAKFTSTMPPTDELEWLWYNGSEKRRLFLAVDEIAVFPKDMPDDWYAFTGEFKATVEEIAHLFHPQAEVSELNDFCITIKSPESVTLKELPGLLERIAQHPFLRSAGPVLYGYQGDPYTEKIPTGGIIVSYPLYYTDAQIRQIEEEYDLIRDESEWPFDRDVPLYVAESPWEALELANRLFESGRVEYAYPEWISAIIYNSTTGSDPLQESEASADYWHFQGLERYGANIFEAWKLKAVSGEPIQGDGVTVAIVDDAVEINHPDLTQNVEKSLCYNFLTGGEKDDPSPQIRIDSLPKDASKIQLDGGHGTGCAGIVAAVKGNTHGVYGIAPNAKIAGFRQGEVPIDPNTGGVEPAHPREGGKDYRQLCLYNDTIQIYNNSWTKRMFEPLSGDDNKALQWGTLGKNKGNYTGIIF